MGNLRKSMREKASWPSLKEVMPPIRNLRTPSIENILAHRRNMLRKHRDVREQQQADKGLAEFPFELIDTKTNKVIKKSYMSDHDARARNHYIRSLDMAWRRSGY